MWSGSFPVASHFIFNKGKIAFTALSGIKRDTKKFNITCQTQCSDVATLRRPTEKANKSSQKYALFSRKRNKYYTRPGADWLVHG